LDRESNISHPRFRLLGVLIGDLWAGSNANIHDNIYANPYNCYLHTQPQRDNDEYAYLHPTADGNLHARANCDQNADLW
jgi:uroporphyrinogen-III decarboxylase